jgi:cytochrome c553
MSTKPLFPVGLVLALVAATGQAAEPRTGQQIYKQQCAWCHGARGEGKAKHYDKPLAGSRSLAQLRALIAKTMPEDDPGSLPAADAEKVAAYVYGAFYSKTAQDRKAPPRIELARLTVNQYRNSVADLIGSFRSPGRWDEEHGLDGDYFGSRRGKGGKPLLSRRDGEIRFQFGSGSPDADRIPPQEFTIRWRGSVFAPETGDYDFVVRTENGVRLWVNDTRRPLIDAGVKSGNDVEQRASIRLLGGRAYPVRLECTKAKSEKTGSITLAWKVPGLAEQVVPRRNLSPHTAPELFVATTPFPPDDRSVGYERGSSLSSAWVQATRDASLETAAYVVNHLGEVGEVPESGPDRQKRAHDFCRRFAERAFRRPLTEEQTRHYVDRPLASTADLEAGVKRVVLLVLNSPRFLYPEITGRPDAYDVASRLSLGLWDSLPDQELVDGARAGRLGNRADVARQAERMLNDPRAHAKLRGFFLQWLKLDPAPDLAKNRSVFPDFDPPLASDLRTSLELFLEDALWKGGADFRELLQADYVYLNGRLASYYGCKLASDAPFQKVKLDAGQRAGVLTHPYVMAALAYTDASSPIHRGVFLMRSVLGQGLRPPPEAVAPLAPDLHPDMTTRERVAMQTKPQACQSCHGVINPLGFTLEHFDAVGRFRAKEKGRLIEATGTYQTPSGQMMRFNGGRDLAKYLAQSDEVQDAIVEQLFHHLVRQPVRAYGPQQGADLKRAFVASGYNLRKLVVNIMTATALKPREERVARVQKAN